MPRERGDLLKDLMDSVFLMDEELAVKAAKEVIEAGYDVYDAINNGLVAGMNKAGVLYEKEEYFVPELLIAARAMKAATAHLKPFFQAGSVHARGTVVIGTVAGDLHDIGKNLVAMTVEGAGWEVIDLGVDVKVNKFLEAIERHPDCVVGLSALLTTTMGNMETLVKEIKTVYPEKAIIIGGAPLTQEFSDKIGASGYSSSPQGAVNILNQLVA